MDSVRYLPRYATSLLLDVLEVSPVVVLMGARQTGKSTLVRSEPRVAEAGERLYLTLDDLTVRERAVEEPDSLLRSAPRLTLDEVQREPDLILAIKRAVDADPVRRPGRFLLTGSANLLMMQRISETLAGRATYVTLWPLTTREKQGVGSVGAWSELVANPFESWPDLLAQRDGAASLSWREEVRRGGYPTPALELGSAAAREIWFDGYVRTYLERDLQDLAAIDNLLDFRRLMRAACLRLGNLVNQADLGRDTRIPRPTVHRYLNLLETSYQLVRVEPYAVNRTKRLVKTPKLYWSDPGLALYLAGEEPSGHHLEALVLNDLLAWADGQIPRPEILFWRTSTDLEVDFVIEHRAGLLPVEVKSSRQVRRDDARGLAAFRDEYPDLCLGGLLLYDGEEVQWLSDRVLAVPWQRVI